jgi:hypothetical protein
MAVVQRLYQLQPRGVSIVGQASRMLLGYASMYEPFCNVDVCEYVMAGASDKSELMTSRRAQNRGCSFSCDLHNATTCKSQEMAH